MKYITKKIVKSSVVVLFFTIVACCYSSMSYAQGYMGKKTLIGYRFGINPIRYYKNDLIGSMTHEVSLERVKNRRMSYGVELTYSMGGQATAVYDSYDFNLIMPVVFLRIHSLRKGGIAPLGIANKLGIGFASQNYMGTTPPESNVALVLSWSLMRRMPISKSLLFDYGTGITVPITGDNSRALMVNTLNIRFGLTFATK